MTDQTVSSLDVLDDYESTPQIWDRKAFLWSLPQPILVLGSMFLVATMVAHEWMNHRLYALIMMVLPIPLLIVAERIWTKRKDWILKPNELAEDGFWLAMGGLLWGPLISDYYRTPVSEGFRAVRDFAPLQITIEPETVGGLIAAALRFVSVRALFITGYIGFNTSLCSGGVCMPPTTTSQRWVACVVPEPIHWNIWR